MTSDHMKRPIVGQRLKKGERVLIRDFFKKGTVEGGEVLHDFTIYDPECFVLVDGCTLGQWISMKFIYKIPSIEDRIKEVTPPHRTSEENPCRCYLVAGIVRGPLDDHTDDLCLMYHGTDTNKMREYERRP